MPYIPQPLKNIKETVGEKMEKDADYAILLSDINDYTVSVFSNFQKQAVPVIQENYIQRNMIFSKCHDKLKSYKESYKDVETDLEDQFQAFKKKLLEHIEDICEQRRIQQDEEIVVNRDRLNNVQTWVTEVNKLLEEAGNALQRYEKFYHNAMNNHTSNDSTSLDINFFEENARNQEKLMALDDATAKLEQLTGEYKARDDEIQNIVKEMQQRFPQ